VSPFHDMALNPVDIKLDTKLDAKFDTGFRFNAASVLNPIAGPSPTGESLRYEGTYDKIRDARTEDNPVLAQGVWKAPLKNAQWGEVARLCLDAIETRTKDIQIAAWLTEAWLHLYGLAGLREGLRVTAAICERFWDQLHPRSESDEDLEYRLAPFEWINDKLPPVVRLLPLTAPTSDDMQTYSWNDWETSTRPTPAGGAAQFQQSAMMTPTALYLALSKVLESAGQACSQLEECLQKRCGDRAASLRQLANVLEQIRGFVRSTLDQRNDGYQETGPRNDSDRETRAIRNAEEPATQNASDDSEPYRQPYGRIGPICDRSEAYRRLGEAADYLARTEPHSPTPYLVRRAIAWGSLRLEELLPELIHNSSELGDIFRLLQIDRPRE
jgi:type VI secretion system protein ImpA